MARPFVAQAREAANVPGSPRAVTGRRSQRRAARHGCCHKASRIIWVKAKCLNRQEFVAVGWTDAERSRKDLGARLLGDYEGCNLIYAGRVGTGTTRREMGELRRRLEPLAIDKMPPAASPWTDNGLLRHVVYQSLREDKRASVVRLERPPS
jgi:ATP-dependent DNA ligase